MTAHLTEEEQLEALKRWWQENGKFTVVLVALVVAGWFGWQGWQERQRQQAEAASLVYQDLVEASIVEADESLAEDKRATATHLAGQLKSEYASSQYAQNAALYLAKLAVESRELDKAVAELQWVLDQNPEQGVELVTRLRLARVYAAQNAYEKALTTLEGDNVEAFAAAYAEVRGDIYVAQNKAQQARAAYQLALDKLLPGQASRRELIQIKLGDLQ